MCDTSPLPGCVLTFHISTCIQYYDVIFSQEIAKLCEHVRYYHHCASMIKISPVSRYDSLENNETHRKVKLKHMQMEKSLSSETRSTTGNENGNKMKQIECRV